MKMVGTLFKDNYYYRELMLKGVGFYLTPFFCKRPKLQTEIYITLLPFQNSTLFFKL